jgi:hypothetical protein
MPKRKKLYSADHKTLRHHHNLLLLCILALFLVLGFLSLKYFWMRSSWHENSAKLQSGIQKYQELNSIEDAKVLAATLTTLPAGNPLIKQKQQLQKYIETLSKETGRDVVVLDKNKVIIADTVSANTGNTYTEDTNGEVNKTIFDGEPRTFLEKSIDYPDGIKQTVIQLKDSKGTIIGALIVSSSNIFNK